MDSYAFTMHDWQAWGLLHWSSRKKKEFHITQVTTFEHSVHNGNRVQYNWTIMDAQLPPDGFLEGFILWIGVFMWLRWICAVFFSLSIDRQEFVTEAFRAKPSNVHTLNQNCTCCVYLCLTFSASKHMAGKAQSFLEIHVLVLPWSFVTASSLPSCQQKSVLCTVNLKVLYLLSQ